MTPTKAETTPAPERSVARILARNTAVGIAAQLALKLATIVFQVFIVNTLGEGRFGQYNIVLAWAGLFAVLGDLGVTQYMRREVARDPANTDRLFWDTACLRFILAVVTTIVTVGGALVLTDYSPEIILGMLIFCGTYFIQVLMEPLASVLSGNERTDVVNGLYVAMNVLYMLFATLFLLAGFSFEWLFVAGLINMPIIIIIQIIIMRRMRFKVPSFKATPGRWLSLLRAGLPFTLTQIALSVTYQVDTVMLSSIFRVSDAFIGWYSTAYRLVFVVLNLVYAFSEAALPTMAREHEDRPEVVRAWYFGATRVLFFIGLPVAVGGMIMADEIIAFLYRDSIFPAWVALAVIIWDVPFVLYHSFCGNVAQSIRKENAAARIFLTMAVSNVIINLILIPPFGILGSAFATVLTDAVGALMYYILLRRYFGFGLKFTRVIRMAAGALVMALVLLPLKGIIHVIPLIALGGVVYLAFVWFSGAFTAEEKANLLRIVDKVRARLRPARAA